MFVNFDDVINHRYSDGECQTLMKAIIGTEVLPFNGEECRIIIDALRTYEETMHRLHVYERIGVPKDINAMQAIGKAIPKKPIDGFMCPCCGAVDDAHNDWGELLNFCGICGQALDGGEKNA